MKTASEVLAGALHAYTAGRLEDALAALETLPAADPLPEAPEWALLECERRAAAPWSPETISAAARDWIQLARDRIRRELGEDVAAVVPVPLAIMTALSLIQQAASNGR